MTVNRPYSLSIAYLLAALVFLVISYLAVGTTLLSRMVEIAAVSMTMAFTGVAILLLFYGIFTNS